VEVSNRDALLALMGETPCFSIGAHWHRHGTYFLREGEDTGRHDHGSGIEHGAPEDGDSSHADHHVHAHVVQGTTSGSWYQGAPDEYGLPHTMMRDGKPNGWSILAFERTPSGELDYAIRYKAARRSWADQLHLWAPEEVGVASSAEVIANVYAGSERSTVEMRVRHVASGFVSAWAPMEMYTGVDPYWAALKRLESSETPPPGKRLTNLDAQTLLWRGTLAPMDEPGAAVIEVRTTDMFGQTFTGRRLVRVVEAGDAGAR
jgi:hypothetical protein